MVIAGRTSLLALIDREKTRQNISDAELARRAGIGPNTLGNLRYRRFKSMNFTTVLAIVTALGFDLTITPEHLKGTAE